MAKKNETTEVIAEAKEVASLILAPRITEKASLQSEVNAYTFIVDANASKLEIAKEIKSKYGVSPVKVNVSNQKGTRVFVRGKWGVTASSRKATVFLKKGDSIAFAK